MNPTATAWAFKLFQAVVIGAMPALLQRFREQALGYMSVNASNSAMDAVAMIGFVYWLTIAGALLFLLTALLHLRRKTPHALLVLLACGITFVVSTLAIDAQTDDAWAARVRAEPGPCQEFFRARKQLGQDGATQSFLVGACQADLDVPKESKP